MSSCHLQTDREVGECGTVCDMGARICGAVASAAFLPPLQQHPSVLLHHFLSAAVVCGAYGAAVVASLPHRLLIHLSQELGHQLACSGRRAEGCGERIVAGNGAYLGHSGCLSLERPLDQSHWLPLIPLPLQSHQTRRLPHLQHYEGIS